MQPIIKVENLSKKYHINSEAANAATLRDVLTGIFKSSRSSKEAEKEKEIFWALKDINFTVDEGETLGIIGNNGAGKSTLLKVLSRITKPSSGNIELLGRVGSLLEVGTGFHNELSGRENIFLNGAILGMRRDEIVQNFDKIVEFADLERFIDTPVKHYSSGMYMRLAFSIAVHLRPEILIVDEVLAVGDVNFQLKCLDKMEEIMNDGRTILFVSHSMSDVTRLCARSIALKRGKIISQGPTQKVVDEYLNLNERIASEREWNIQEAPQNEVVRLVKCRMVNSAGKTCQAFQINEEIGIETTYEILEDENVLIPGFQILSQERLPLFLVQDVTPEWHRKPRKRGIYTSTAWFTPNLFAEGHFIVDSVFNTYLPENRVHIQEEDLLCFEILDPMDGTTARGDFKGIIPGMIRPMANWQTSYNM